MTRVAAAPFFIGAGASAAFTLLMLLFPAGLTAAVVILGAQVMLAVAAAWYMIRRSSGPKRASRPQPAAQPPYQPPTTALAPVAQPPDDILIRMHNRPQPLATGWQPVVQPPATAPQPLPTAPQPAVQPAVQPPREPVELPFPLANGHHRERQTRPRVEIPWQPAPWDALANDAPAPADGEDTSEPAAAALLPRRPPTAADYIVIRQALADCDGSRRRACVVVYGSRDGQTYPWLRRVADYWEISDADRPGILAWELLGTRDIPGHLAQRLGLDMTDDQISAALDAARLTRCAECDAWSTLDELDENDACTRCTS
ncbi:MAG: hypothetical protein IPK78_18175 [Rhodospirillales bacterium]|nr:hypothetical protein [Rhodospirillales bacterium]